MQLFASKNFMEKISPPVQAIPDLLWPEGGAPKPNEFPDVPIMMNGDGNLAAYPKSQVNLLSDIACWSVLEAWDQVAPFFDEA